MKKNGNKVLITGGEAGISLALAKAFVEADNEVIVCVRTEDQLEHVKKKLPQLYVRKCNISNETECHALHNWVMENYEDLNVLINSNCIQRMVDFKKGTEDLIRHRVLDGEDEIGVNFSSLVYLTACFTPHLIAQKEAAIMNISSWLAFHPMPLLPICSATKAAVHAFSVALRNQLEGTSVRVFEFIQPMVDASLDRAARKVRGQMNFGITTDELIPLVMKAFELDEYEIQVIDPGPIT